MIQLDGYFCIHLSGRRQNSMEKNTSSVSPGTMVHVNHVLFVFFAVLGNLRASFSLDNTLVHALDVLLKTPPIWF